MIGEQWVFAAFAILLGGHVLALLYAWVARGVDAWESVDGAGGRPDEADGVCRCRECGTENDSGFRFCRNCVAELPTSRPRPAGQYGRGQPY